MTIKTYCDFMNPNKWLIFQSNYKQMIEFVINIQLSYLDSNFDYEVQYYRNRSYQASPMKRTFESSLSKRQKMEPVKKAEAYDYMVKIIIVGDSGVGKTNIISRFCENNNDQSSFRDYHVATIGVDFSVKYAQIEDKRLKLQIWDTAGQQRFKTITQTYYKGAAGIILVYSVDSQQSFQGIEKWIEQVNCKSAEGVRKILVANKIDVEENDNQDFCVDQRSQVPSSRGQAMARQYDMQFYEVSAKNNSGIRQMFEDLSLQIKRTIDKEVVVSNQVCQASMSITLDSRYARTVRRVKKQGIQYRVEEGRSVINKIKEKCC